MKKFTLAAILLLISTATLAGNGPPTTPATVPIMGDLAMAGMSLVLAGIAARFAIRNFSKR